MNETMKFIRINTISTTRIEDILEACGIHCKHMNTMKEISYSRLIIICIGLMLKEVTKHVF